jgi:hypothetical protein
VCERLRILGFEVLTGVAKRSSSFWYITLCSPLNITQEFEVICLNLQDRRICQARKASKAGN